MKVEIEGQKVESDCFNCGEKIHLDERKPFMVLFDRGTPDTRVTPGEPASVVLYCYDCAKAEGI